MPTITVGTGPGFDHSTIQAAINAADPGDTITVAAGVYHENIVVNKDGLTLIGDGDDTVIEGTFKTDNSVTGSVADHLKTAVSYSPGSGTGVTIAADGVTIQSLKIDSFNVGIDLGNGVDDVTIQDVVVEDTVNGIRKGSGAAVTDLDLIGGEIRDSYIGMYLAKETATGLDIDDVLISGTAFTNLVEKGIYAESLSNALITGITMTNVGEFGRGPSFGSPAQVGGFGGGIDLNLKWDHETTTDTVDDDAPYSGITIEDFVFTNVGSSDQDGGASSHSFGAAIAVKARDAGSYASPEKASFDGAVVIQNGTIDGTSTGIRAGEPGQNITDPDVTITNVGITNEVHDANHGDVNNLTMSITTVNLADGGDSLIVPTTATGAFVVNGGDGADTITTAGGDDTINGGDGDDTLDGGAGADLLAGGDDDDTYHADSSDTIVESAGEGTDEVVSSDSIVLSDNVENLTLVDAATNTQIFDDMALGAIADGENGWKFAGPVVDQAIFNQGGGDNAFHISSDPANGTFGGPYSPQLGVAAGEPGLSDYQGQSIRFTLQAVSPGVDGSRLEIDFANADGTDRNNFMVVESTGSGLRIAVNEPLAIVGDNWANDDFSAFTGNVTLASGIDQTVAHQIDLRLNYVAGSDNDTIDIYVDGEFIGSTTTFENYREFNVGQDHDVAAAANLTSRVLFRVGDGGQPQDGPLGQNRGFNIDDLSNSVYGNTTGTGNADANVIKGNSGNNALFGLGGADTLQGNAGNDTLEGDADTDTAVFLSSLGAGNFSFVGGQWVVTTTGLEGKDTLNDIEKVAHAGANKFLLVGGNGYANIAAAEADQTAGDIILTPSTPVVGATAPAHLVEAAAAPGTSSAAATITMSDPIGTVDYDFVELVGWSNEGGGIFTKAGALGTATLNTNANTLTFALNNAAANSLSATDHPTEQFEIPVVNQFGVKSSTVVTFTIDGANDAPAEPTDTNGAANSVVENAANTAVVNITAQSTDPEDDTLTYSLTDDAGGRFEINATTGVVGVLDGTKLDFEAATSHTITVKVVDGNGGEVLRNFTINIADAQGKTINGGGGADTISGTSAPLGQADGFATTENDTIFGGGGNDTISSLAGNDLVNGGAGNDAIRGGDDADRLNGGIGTDTASYAGSDAGVIVDLRRTTAQSGGDAQGDRLISVENVTGSNFADRLIGNASNNILRGAGGDDDLRGGPGDDKLVGGVGNDSLRGNAGSDTFFFATGYDADTVHDYAAGVDEFNFRGTSIVRYSQLQAHMTEVSGDVVINLGSGDKLTILDTTIAILNNHTEDFHF